MTRKKEGGGQEELLGGFFPDETKKKKEAAKKENKTKKNTASHDEGPELASAPGGVDTPATSPPRGFDPELAEYLDDFLLEYGEHIEGIETSLLALDRAPDDAAAINNCFRGYHSLKGIAIALGFDRLGSLCHDIESTLSIYRGEGRPLSTGLIDILLHFTDLLVAMKNEIEQNRTDTATDVGDIVDQVARFRTPLDDREAESERRSQTSQREVFQQELGENIDTIDEALLTLEKGEGGTDEVNAIFRLAHNIKGISNALRLDNLREVTHRVESALEPYRQEGFAIPKTTLDAFFEYNDLLRQFRRSLANAGDDTVVDISSLLIRLDQLPPPVSAAPTNDDAERKEMLDSYMPDFLQEYGEHVEVLDQSLLKLEKEPGDAEEINNTFRQIHNLKGMANALGFPNLTRLCHAAESALMIFREKKDPLPLRLVELCLDFNDQLRAFHGPLSSTYTEGEIDVSELVSSFGDIKEGAPDDGVEKPEAKPMAKKKGGAIASVMEKINTIRVNVGRLDSLMNSVGELVLLRNRYNQLNHRFSVEGRSDTLLEDFNSLASQLDMVTGSLQGAVMRTRMLPVGNIFSKFNRVVRDLCHSLDKEADLVIAGADTELDKNLIEAISDPLMHVVRNSLDHGLEEPDERERLGKPRRGTVQLNAFQEGNSIIIEIIDDGRGIDPDALVAKALEKKLLTPEQVEVMSPAERLTIIFLPGFSTAQVVSGISGRGVGMDVVKTNIEKLKGQIDLDSRVGEGTRMKIRIPLTLAIMPTLLCALGEERFALPLFSVMETVRLAPDEVERISGASVIRLRDEILPVVYLRDLMNRESSPVAEEPPEQEEDATTAGGRVRRKIDIVVLRVGIKQVGLAVDKTLGQEEVLIKPLDALKGIYEPEHLSGATILGDGRIALILDVATIITHAQLLDTDTAEGMRHTARLEEEDLTLLLSDGGVEQYGIELDGINKIDIVGADQVEYVGGNEVVQYNHEILPVSRIPYITDFETPGYYRKLYLVVVKSGDKKAGLLVNELSGLRKIRRKDILASTGRVDMESALIVNDRVTIILSREQIITSASKRRDRPAFMTRTEASSRSTDHYHTVLVVDDSKSQREALGGTLRDAGHEIIFAIDGDDALEKLEGVDLVVTDLDMPNMDGCELTRMIKSTFPELVVFMLTSYGDDENITKALDAGVDQFFTKSEPEALLLAVARGANA